MTLKLRNLPLAAEILRCAELAAARFALREAGMLLRAAAPLATKGAEKLDHLSQHPILAAPPPSLDLK